MKTEGIKAPAHGPWKMPSTGERKISLTFDLEDPPTSADFIAQTLEEDLPYASVSVCMQEREKNGDPDGRNFIAALRYSKYDQAQASVKKFDELTGSEKQEKIHPLVPWILVVWAHLYHIGMKMYGKAIIPRMVYHVVATQILARAGWLREYLMDSTRCLNAYYDVQLFSWLAVLIVDILDTIVLGVNLSQHNRVLHIAFMIGVYISIVHSFIQLATITYTCHRISDEANKLGTILFTPKSPVWARSTSYIETAEIGFYLTKAPLKITVLSMIDVHLDLIITIVGNIVTYLSVFKS
ncbi:hypothetical protein WH47_01124 [Habropoda laboriosa]|uniref:Gustatory receptor n=1 Tax=Habropoda laboriosa TaxID=597456 RepID=A0A0L7QYT6_9HYME|nr:hypothetical protein WH47_01124 [Habropoda laboriosa]